MSDVESMNRRFADAYKTTCTYPPAMWFPELRVINREPGFVELDFSLSSDSELEADELAAIAAVLGVEPSTLEQEYEGGGCDTCGYGARTTVRIPITPPKKCT